MVVDVEGKEVELRTLEGIETNEEFAAKKLAEEERKATNKTVEVIVPVEVETLVVKTELTKLEVISVFMKAGMSEKAAKGQSTKTMAKRETIPKKEMIDTYTSSKSTYREGILKALAVDVLALNSGTATTGADSDKVLSTISRILQTDDMISKYCYDEGKQLDLTGLDNTTAIINILIAEGKSQKMAESIAKRYNGGIGSKYTITLLSGGEVMPILCKDVR